MEGWIYPDKTDKLRFKLYTEKWRERGVSLCLAEGGRKEDKTRMLISLNSFEVVVSEYLMCVCDELVPICKLL
jgi:hypothetical protein